MQNPNLGILNSGKHPIQSSINTNAPTVYNTNIPTSTLNYGSSSLSPHFANAAGSTLRPISTSNVGGISSYQSNIYGSRVAPPIVQGSYISPVHSNQTYGANMIGMPTVMPMQVSQATPILIDQRQITTVPRVTQYVHQQPQQTVVHEVVQPKIIEETVVHHNRMENQDNRVYFNDNPEVNVNHESRWMSHYHDRRQIFPPPDVPETKSKGCCKAPLLALLGLLALGGLIAAIVLGAKKFSEHNVIDHGGHSNGIPQQSIYPEYTVTQTVVTVQNYGNNQTHPTNNIEHTNHTKPHTMGPIIVSPVPMGHNYSTNPISTKPTSSSSNNLQKQPPLQTSSSISPSTLKPIVVAPVAATLSQFQSPVLAHPSSSIQPEVTNPVALTSNKFSSSSPITSSPNYSSSTQQDLASQPISQNLGYSSPVQNQAPTFSIKPISVQPVSSLMNSNPLSVPVSTPVAQSPVLNRQPLTTVPTESKPISKKPIAQPISVAPVSMETEEKISSTPSKQLEQKPVEIKQQTKPVQTNQQIKPVPTSPKVSQEQEPAKTEQSEKQIKSPAKQTVIQTEQQPKAPKIVTNQSSQQQQQAEVNSSLPIAYDPFKQLVQQQEQEKRRQEQEQKRKEEEQRQLELQKMKEEEAKRIVQQRQKQQEQQRIRQQQELLRIQQEKKRQQQLAKQQLQNERLQQEQIANFFEPQTVIKTIVRNVEPIYAEPVAAHLEESS